MIQHNPVVQDFNATNYDGGFPLAAKFAKFMTVKVDEQKQRVEVHLRGNFSSPQENTNELVELYQLAEKYTSAIFYINSSGGRVDMLLELASIMKMFKHTITVACSQVASAGFMLWAVGEVRVTQPHTEFMGHREFYGYGGKTDQHNDLLVHNKRRFDAYIQEVFGSILNEYEMDKIKYTEVWLTDGDVIERGKAIDWNTFMKRDNMTPQLHNVVVYEGKAFLVNDSTGNLIPVSISEMSEEEYDPFDIVFKGTDTEEHTGDETDALRFIGKDAYDNSLSEKKLRERLKDVIGKGNFVIRKTGDILVHTDLGDVDCGNFKTGTEGRGLIQNGDSQ